MSDLPKTTPQPETEKAESATPNKKSSFGEKFMTFLSMGGFLLILVLLVGIVVAISILFKCK